ncbi:LuxR family transcriptional regulator [Pseudomonas sp. VLB120]|nr:LuxR family transcriptional regulator [Pseudomonas sp. VLB120]
MLNRTALDWERLREPSALLEEIPALADELGFHFYSFSYSCASHEVYVGNLLPGGLRLVQAALDFRPHDRQWSHAPVLWTKDAFLKSPRWWKVAQVLGLRHGWVQPLRDGMRQSSLALLRPHVSVSTPELYQKAAQVMWLSERLHLAANQSDMTLMHTHEPCGTSFAR